MNRRMGAAAILVTATLLSGAFLRLHRQPGGLPSVRRFNIPVYFEPNLGQFPGDVLYAGSGLGYGLTLKANEVDVSRGSKKEDRASGLPDIGASSAGPMLRTVFVGANEHARVEGLHPLAAKIRYVFGSNLPEISSYGRIRYRQLYPGIDLDYYEQQGRLEYDFVVAPGFRPDAIRLRFSLDPRLPLSPQLDRSGNLDLAFGEEEIQLQKPTIYQEVNGSRRSVAGGFRQLGEDGVGFSVGDYDPNLPLIIDPTLVFSRIWNKPAGTSEDSWIRGLAADAAGNVYVVGGPSAGVTIFGPDGTLLRQFTGLAPQAFVAEDVALDSSGNIYVAATVDFRSATESAAYEKNPAYPGACAAPNATTGTVESASLLKLSPSGARLYATCFPHIKFSPSSNEVLHNYAGRVAADERGDAYFAGYLRNTTNNTAGAEQPFVAKVNTAGGPPLYYLHIAQTGRPSGVAFDNSRATVYFSCWPEQAGDRDGRRPQHPRKRYQPDDPVDA